jgi:ABC-type branched-subunit amino acid transport system ATPase component
VSSRLVVENVTKRYGGVLAVSEAALSIEPGQIHGLIGPNGAGKSTLLALISGFTRPDSGAIRYGERDLAGSAPLAIVRAGISRTFQGATPLPGMTVLENALVGLHTRGTSGILAAMFRTRGQRAEEMQLRAQAVAALAASGVDMPPEADAADLSFGQLRFLEIVRALGTEPQLLLLDEPAAGLNAHETDELGRLIAGLGARGIAVLLVDHDVPFVFATCSTITVMDFGRIIASGTPEEIERDPAVRAAYLSTEEEATAS